MLKNVNRLQAFVNAAKGLMVLAKQTNAQLQALALLLTLCLSGYFKIDRWEWVAVCLASVFVLALEALNTAIEIVVDQASPEWSEWARQAKDVSATAVLLASVAALAVGFLVFGPRFFQLAWG